MATYAAYRHIELDNVGYSKKRVRNQTTDIFGGGSSPMPRSRESSGSNLTPHRQQRLSDSFTRLFGSPEPPSPASVTAKARRSSLNRNPVTGDGVDCWDCRPASRANTPRRIERNPVTGEGLSESTPSSGSPSSVGSPAKPSSHIAAILNDRT